MNKHEDFLYEIYEPTLKIAGTSSRPFIGFSKENLDQFTRLKWRWIYNNLKQENPFEYRN